VIDKAISENQLGELLLYGLAGTFASIGSFVLVWATLHGESLVAVAGSIASSLFWPAIRSARQTRKESIAIRLLEAPLSRADTAKEAADMLHRFFDSLMLERTRAAQTDTPAVATKGQ
jgi:hypothetical protein